MSSAPSEVKVEPTAVPLQDMDPQINANSKKRSHSEVVDDTRDVKKPKVEPANARDKRRKKKKSKRKASVVVPDSEPKDTAAVKTRSVSRLSSTKPLSALAPVFVPDAITRGTKTEVDDLAFLSSSSSGSETRVEAGLATAAVTTPSVRPIASGSGTSSAVEDDSTSQASEIARLKKELASQTLLVQRHQAHLDLLQNSLTCQICLDIMQKPFVLSPCGHVTCYTCLVRWFTAPQNGAGAAGVPANDNNGDGDDPQPPGNPPDVEHILNGNVSHTWKRKTCPICRGAVKQRPIEVWAIKDMVQNLMRSNLVDLPPHLGSPALPASNNEGRKDKDPWRRIFPAVQPTGAEQTGIWDDEDAVFRCIDCHHEIWDQTCARCGRVYPGADHGDDLDDDIFGLGGALGLDLGISDEDDEEDDEDDIYGGLEGFLGPFSDDSMSDAEVEDDTLYEHIHDAWLAEMLPAGGEDDGIARIDEVSDEDGDGFELEESDDGANYVAYAEGEESDDGGSFIEDPQEGDLGHYPAVGRRGGYGARYVYSVDGDSDNDSEGDDDEDEDDEIEVGPVVRNHTGRSARAQFIDLEASSGSEEDPSDGDGAPLRQHGRRAGGRILNDDEDANPRTLARRLGGRARVGRRVAVESSEDDD